MPSVKSLYRSHRVHPRRSRLQELQVAPRIAGLGCYACDASRPMGALGMSLLTKALRISTPGPNAVKLKSTPKEVKKVLAVAGPALAVIPGYGTALAAGAAVITRADQQNKAKRLQAAAQNAGDPNALLQAYGEIAGQVPGRVIGLDALKQVMNAIGATGGWPNVKKWKAQAVEDVFVGCKGCTPPTIPDWVKEQLSSGTSDPMAMVGPWNAHVNSTWGSKWLVGTAGNLQNQVLTDVFDYEVSQFAPQAPQTYGLASPDVPSAVPTAGPVSSVSTTPGVAAPSASPPATVAPPTPGGSPAVVTPPTSGTDPNLQAYVQALMRQGASQQQAFTAALAAIGNSGQAVTPQTQAEVASAVQQASSSPLPASMLYIVGGLAGLALIGFMMKKGKRS